MKHIVQLIVERDGCTEYQVFEAAALALAKLNHRTVAHLWWVRYMREKTHPIGDPLFGVPHEVMNHLLNVMFPPKRQKLLMGGL